MKQLARAALALALIAGLSPAIAQQFPTVPAQSVIGRLGIPGDTGPSQAIPFSTLSKQLNSLVGTLACAGNDDTATIQAAINAAPATHAFLIVPANTTCAWKGVLDFKGHNNLTLSGIGSGFGSSGNSSSRMIYAGPNIPRAMDFRDTSNNTIIGLSIENVAASMTGFLIDAGGTNPGVTLSLGFSFKDSSIFGGTQAGTASGCLNLSESQLATVDHVWFQRCQPAIRGQVVAGQSTAAKINSSTFTTHTGQAIIGCGEAWSFTNDTWEPDINGRANAFSNNGAVACKSVLFDNPWMGDATVAGGTWITFLGNGLEVRGGRITTSPSAPGSEAVSIVTGSTGIKISGPAIFEDFTNAIDFNNGTVTGVQVGGGVTFLGVANKFIQMSGVTGFALAEGNSPSTSQATAGQLLIGQSSADAAWKTLTGQISITAGGVTSCPVCVLISGTGHGDSNYQILSTDRYVYINAAFTAPRTWTLPAANSVTVGTTIWVQDALNTITSTNTLTVQRAGADTLNGSGTSTVITGNSGGITFTSDGVSNWGVPEQTVTTGGTGQATLTNHGVLIGAGINPVTQLGVAATGTVLSGVTGADPAFTATPTVTSINKVAITPPATGSTLTIADGKTATFSNSLTFVGTDATSLTFPSTGGTVATISATQTFTNKTYDTAGAGNSFLINGLAATANTGTGAVVRATSPALVTPALGAATATTINGVSIGAGQISGEPSTGSATAGNIGQYIESVIASGSAVALTSGAPTNVTSISLPAGDWDVNGIVYLLPAATTSVTRYAGGVSTTSATFAGPGTFADFSQPAFVSGGNTFNDVIPPFRFSLAGTTTVFLVALGSFSVSTAAAYGIIRARRMR